jgi:AhpC/TSA family
VTLLAQQLLLGLLIGGLYGLAAGLSLVFGVMRVALERGREFSRITDRSHPSKWLVLFAWPMDFTFVCPTEIAEFGKRHEEFEDRDTQVLGHEHGQPVRAPGLAP